MWEFNQALLPLTHKARGIGDSEVSTCSRHFILFFNPVLYYTWTQPAQWRARFKLGGGNVLNVLAHLTWRLATVIAPWKWSSMDFYACENRLTHSMSAGNVNFLRVKMWQGCWTLKTQVYGHLKPQQEQSIECQSESREGQRGSSSSFHRKSHCSKEWKSIILTFFWLHFLNKSQLLPNSRSTYYADVTKGRRCRRK